MQGNLLLKWCLFKSNPSLSGRHQSWGKLSWKYTSKHICTNLFYYYHKEHSWIAAPWLLNNNNKKNTVHLQLLTVSQLQCLAIYTQDFLSICHEDCIPLGELSPLCLFPACCFVWFLIFKDLSGLASPFCISILLKVELIYLVSSTNAKYCSLARCSSWNSTVHQKRRSVGKLR